MIAELDYRSLSDRTKQMARHMGYKGRTIRFKHEDNPTISNSGMMWDGGSRDYCWLWNPTTGDLRTVPAPSFMNKDSIRSFTIEPGWLGLELHIYRGKSVSFWFIGRSADLNSL